MPRFAPYCGNVEPSVDELLSDPIIHRLMARDGVAPSEVYDVMAAARRRFQNRDIAKQPRPYHTIEPAKT